MLPGTDARHLKIFLRRAYPLNRYAICTVRAGGAGGVNAGGAGGVYYL